MAIDIEVAEAVAARTIGDLRDIWTGVAGEVQGSVLEALTVAERTLSAVLLESDPDLRSDLLSEIDDAVRTLLEAQEEHLQQGAKDSLLAVSSGTFRLVTSIVGAIA